MRRKSAAAATTCWVEAVVLARPRLAGIAIRASTFDPRLELGPESRCQLGATTPTKSDEIGDSRQRSEGADVADMQG